jgi:CHASE2 domain-containing sensor protein
MNLPEPTTAPGNAVGPAARDGFIRGRVRLSRRQRSSVAVGVGVCLGWLALWLGPKELEDWSYDLLYAFPRGPTPDEVLLVYQDDESHRLLGQPWLQPWDRGLHARLVDRLARMGARVVAFDILFDLPHSGDPPGDGPFLEAVRNHGRVVVAGVVEPIILDGQAVGYRPTPPFDGLRQVAHWGIAEAGDAERHARRHSRFDARIPTLAWKAAELSERLPAVNPLSERWLRYYGPPGALPSVSYAQMLEDGGVPPTLVSNKVVFIGAQPGVGFTGGKGTDDFSTPYTRWSARRSPGVEINATVFLNLVRTDWLRRPSPVVEVLIVGVLGGILCWVLPRFDPMRTTLMGVGFGLALFGFSTVLAARTGFWWPWLVVACVQVPWAILGSWRGAVRAPLEPELEAPHFTVTSAAGQAGSSIAVSLWIHREADRDDVLRLAQGGSFPSTVATAAAARLAKRAGQPFTARMVLPGLNVLEPQQRLSWTGGVASAVFLVTTPQALPPGPRDGVIHIHTSGLQVSALRFSVLIGPAPAFVAGQLETVETRPRKAFACYSHLDRADVLARVQGMRSAVPNLEVFLDVHELRAGQNWGSEVRKAIEASDLFYLFWSRNACASDEVRREWRFALERKGLEFISPVPLEPPEVAPPPPELASKHFSDWSLEILQSRRKT